MEGTLNLPLDLNKYVFLFDIDGVMCSPQEKISDSMKICINSLARKSLIYIVTGNGFLKARDLLDGIWVDGIFSNNGDELRDRKGKKIWDDSDREPLPPKIENTLYMLCMRDSNHFGNRIEWRSPRMINYSKIGRFARIEDRKIADVSWREDTVDMLRAVYPCIDVEIGGSVSIDIHSKGADKSRAGKYINDVMLKKFIFFGDKTAEGGNDYPLVSYVENNFKKENFVLTVSSPEHTIKLVREIEKRI